MYDRTGESDPSLLSGDGDQTWKACVAEVWDAFMNANYEPVLTVIDFLNHKNPEFPLDRQKFRIILSRVRDLVMGTACRFICFPI
jgi:hypothetical protein